MGKLKMEERPRIPFDAHSEYARTYHAHELPQRQAFQPPPPRAQVPFDGTSTMKDTYVQHPLESRYVLTDNCHSSSPATIRTVNFFERTH